MRKTVTLIFALGLLAPGVVHLAGAQLIAGGPKMWKSSSAKSTDRQVVGKIQSLDGAGTAAEGLTLADGTKIEIPERDVIKNFALSPGDSVRVSYVEQGGRNVATLIEVRPTTPN